MYNYIIIYRTSKRSRGSKFVTCGCAAPTADIDMVSSRAAAQRPIAMCMCIRTSACWLTTYGFATSMDTTGSSQNRDERLRRRRERERTRRPGETAEQRPPALLTIY